MSLPVSLRRALLLLLLLALSLPRAASAQPGSSPPFLAIAGALPLALRSGLAHRLDPLAPARRLTLALSLTFRDPVGLNRALASVYNRRSPSYRHFLTPAAIDARFGPDPAAVHPLIRWLATQGLQPRPWNGGPILSVQGDVAHISSAFHVGMWRYRLADGVRFAPDRDPLLPAALAPAVSAIVGLSQRSPVQTPARRAAPLTPPIVSPLRAAAAAHATSLPPSGPGGGYQPGEIAGAYDFPPIYASGYHGEHTRIALVELAPYQRSDIVAFARHYGIALPAINDVSVDGGNATMDQAVEATLDIEELLGVVPGATIDVYGAPNDTTGAGLIDAYSAVYNAGNAQVLSLEWVNCEPLSVEVPGFVGAQHTLFKTLALQGTTVVSATGDAGGYGCADQDPSLPLQPAVNLPASDPYVLAVGASDLTITLNNGASVIGAETAWSCPAAQNTACADRGAKGAGSGGGASVLFHPGDSFQTDLSWQTGPGVPKHTSAAGRGVPDVVVSGEFGDPQDHEYSVYYQGAWKRGGGTSAAAPIWAGLIALADQYLVAQGMEPLGWVNALVYHLAATSQLYPPYHDITSGNNLVFNAGPGWDYATGWGSPDAWNFLRDAVAFVATPGSDATATPGASGVPSGTPSDSPTLVASATPPAAGTPSATPSPGFPSPTPFMSRPVPSGTPRATATPACPATGIGNGLFRTGTLACWHVGGTPVPRLAPSTHFAHHYSVQLSAARPGVAGSVLSQSFNLPAGLAHPQLHIGYWLARSSTAAPGSSHPRATCALACPHAPQPARPLIIVSDPQGRVLLQLPFLPHRDRAWSGLAVALPSHQRRLTLSIAVPPQPAGANILLFVDDVHVGN